MIRYIYDGLKDLIEENINEYIEEEEKEVDFSINQIQQVLRYEVQLDLLKKFPVMMMRYGEATIDVGQTTLESDTFILPITLWIVDNDIQEERLQKRLETITWALYRFANHYHSVEGLYNHLYLTGFGFSPVIKESNNKKQICSIDMTMEVKINRNIGGR